MTIEVKEYASPDGFEQLRDGWRELSAHAASASVFSTWEWQECWWRHYGGGNRLLLLGALRSDRLVGILPLYIARVRLVKGIPMRVLRVVGAGGDTSPDYLGPVLAPGEEQEAADALAGALSMRVRDWDRIDLTDLAGGPFGASLRAALRACELHADCTVHKSIHVARLPDSWDAYLAAMPRDRRYRVRHQRRTAVEKLRAKFDVCSGADADQALSDLVHLHRARWDSKEPGAGAFRSQRYLAFHAEVVTRCAQQDWIRFYRVSVDERPVALMYCYRYRGEVFFFQSGFDPALEKYSLGNILMAHAIESSIKEGTAVFDMLQGDHAYKQSWCNERRNTFRLHCNNATWRGRLHALRQLLARKLRPPREISAPAPA